MNSLTGSILIDFEQMTGTQEERDYHKQVYGAIKLQLSEMEKYEKTSQFISCSNCKMDKASVFDWEQVSSNKEAFKDVFEKCMEQRESVVVWTCSFCETNNVVDSSEIKFAKNNSRVIERAACKLNNGSEKRKDPILLIIFDISGSMQQLLPQPVSEQNKDSKIQKVKKGIDQSSYAGFLQLIKKTKIYQKIVQNEEKEILELVSRHGVQVDANDTDSKYRDYLKKNKLLMGLTELLLYEISPVSNGNEKMQRTSGFTGNVKKTKLTKTIGFIFFNSNVILATGNQNTGKCSVAICDSKESHSQNTQSMIKERVKFDEFEALFNVGACYGSDYTTKISEFQPASLEYKYGDSSHGQTALGPAIVIGLGVVSQHGAGSSIVVVTDGIGNKGIFDQSERWQKALKQYKSRLQKYKCFLTMLQCRNMGQVDRQQVKTCLDEFCRRNQNCVARKIDILLDKNRTAQSLIDDIKKKMVVSINRDNVIWTNQVIIRSQNSNVSFEEDMGKLSQRLHNQQSPTYINPKIDYQKLRERDYLHHFMTQAVIRYENTQTGEQSVFLTYIMQKFIRFNSLKKQTIRKLDNERTFRDMMEYLSAEEENYDISNVPLSFVKKSFRNTLMFSKSICSRSMRFPLGNQNENKEEDAAFFEEIYRRGGVGKEEELEDQSQTL